jgi:crotonobetaine/carnitine-CoA ligase
VIGLTMQPDALAPNAVARWAVETPEQVFLEHVDGRVLSYAEVDARMDEWAGALRASGLGPGARVATFVDDPVDGALAWLGIGRAGMVSVPVNTAHVGRMLDHVLRAAAVEAVVVSTDLRGRLDDVAGALPELHAVLGTDARGEPPVTQHIDDEVDLGADVVGSHAEVDVVEPGHQA